MLLAPGTLLYVKARNERRPPPVQPDGDGVWAAIVAGSVFGAVALWTGRITL